MSIASDAPAARMPLVMRSALLRRKTRGRCVRSSVSSAAGSYGKRRKVSITIRLRHHATSGAREREFHSERSDREYREILPVEAATPRTARSDGVSGMHHRTTVRGVDLIEGTVDSLVRNRGRIFFRRDPILSRHSSPHDAALGRRLRSFDSYSRFDRPRVEKGRHRPAGVNR
jgi:hypothetical protein